MNTASSTYTEIRFGWCPVCTCGVAVTDHIISAHTEWHTGIRCPASKLHYVDALSLALTLRELG